MRFVTYEDRVSDVPAVKLLVLSMARWFEGATLEVNFPSPPPELRTFLRGHSFVELRGDSLDGRAGWNIKPALLLRSLAASDEPVVWLDADLLFVADPSHLFRRQNEDRIILANEYFGASVDGGTERTVAWGFPVGRVLERSVNSCVVGVTRVHRQLLQRWDRLLGSEDYRRAQARPWHDRPTHLFSDQDLLTALLGSSEFAEVPVRWVRRGRDIAHCIDLDSFTAPERVGNLLRRAMPPILHCQGAKPWWNSTPPRDLHWQISPYVLAARDFQGGYDARMEWAEPRTLTARLLRRCFRNHPIATGLLPSIANEVRSHRMARVLLKRLLRRF